MSKELDRLFREKLADHKLTPGEAAWSKVESSLDNKKKGIVWFRAAAAIALLSVLTMTILWVRSDDEKIDTIAKVDSARVTPKEKVTPSPKKPLKTVEPKLPVVKSPSRKVKVYIAQTEVGKEETQIKKEEEQSVPQQLEVAVVNETPQMVVQLEKPVVKPTKSSITLTYTLAPVTVDERNLAATQKKGVQKMVDAVVEAKNSEGVLTELRTMKDDLFALNFKKNNKK